MAVVGLAGGLGPVDEGVQRALVGDRVHPSRNAGVLVAIDEATVERLGPPPWGASTWGEIDAALGRAGLTDVHLVDPLVTLVDGAAPARDGGALVAPTVVRHQRGRAVPFVPRAWGPIAVEDVVLDLPRSQGSAVGLGDRAAGTRSAWCAWTECPTGPDLAAALAAADAGRIHTVPLVSLLDGQAVDSSAGPLLLGVTAPGWAHSLPIGPDGLDVTWPEAVALAAAAASGPQVVTPGPVFLAPLLALLVLLGALAARAERVLPAEAWIVAVAVAAGGAGALLVALGLAVVPVVSMALAGGIGPLLVALGARQHALRFVRRAALDVSRGDLGFAWEEALDGSPAGLLRVLGSLTRNHLPSDRMAWLRPVAGGRVDIVGGWGLSASDFVDGLDVRTVKAKARRARVPGVLRDGSDRAVLVPLHAPSGEVRGWWCVAWGEDEAAPDLDLLVDLAAWVERRLDGERTGSGPSWLRLDSELRAIGTAFARSAEARAAQSRVLVEADFPLATADRAGVIVFRNRAWTEQMNELGLASEPSSLRELAWRLGGEEHLNERMRSLFVDREAVHLGSDERGLRVSPAGGGFVAWGPPAARPVHRHATPELSRPDRASGPGAVASVRQTTPSVARRR